MGDHQGITWIIYGGFLKWGYSQSSSILMGFFLLNHPAIEVPPIIPCYPILFHISPYYSILSHIIPYCPIFHIIPYYSILSHIPCYPKLFNVIPNYSMLSQIIPCYPKLFHVIPYCSILSQIIPCYPVLFHIIPYYSILSHIISYYSILSYIISCYSIFSYIISCYSIFSIILTINHDQPPSNPHFTRPQTRRCSLALLCSFEAQRHALQLRQALEEKLKFLVLGHKQPNCWLWISFSHWLVD